LPPRSHTAARRTPYGERIRVPITGGWLRGPAIAGWILPGGTDWQLLRADGYFALDANYFMTADDGTPIHVRTAVFGTVQTTTGRLTMP
jgi:hypothetical protein